MIYTSPIGEIRAGGGDRDDWCERPDGAPHAACKSTPVLGLKRQIASVFFSNDWTSQPTNRNRSRRHANKLKS
jgi:hypothetical protein